MNDNVIRVENLVKYFDGRGVLDGISLNVPRGCIYGLLGRNGAGMGAKSEHKRNFESGIITDGKAIVAKIMERFDGIRRGTHCLQCKRKKFCADYKDILA
jgi:ABC-type lipopolysaccharide export system ATPase subunit